MNFFERLNLAKRIYLFSGILILSMAALAVAASLSIRQMVQNTQSLAGVRTLQLERVADIEINVFRIALQLRHFMLVKTQSQRDATLADIASKRKAIEDSIRDYSAALAPDEDRK